MEPLGQTYIADEDAPELDLARFAKAEREAQEREAEEAQVALRGLVEQMGRAS